ncbi:MAG: cupin domain-containing protein [Candidatus Pacebacteria bacterium]|nr:cupin domain-containing protein [Candidatus Paceibacterota bacterium]
MKIEKIKITKEDDRGIIYDCDKVGYIFRNKGTISANHTHEEAETLYLVQGKIELTIKNKTEIVKAPIKVRIEKNVYHKLIALTDIIIIRD